MSFDWELFEDQDFSDFEDNDFDFSANSLDDSMSSDHVAQISNSVSNDRKKAKKVSKRSELGKLKRNMRRRVNFIPRVLKRDIRRTYPLMYSNVVNTLNPDLMMNFLSAYCIPSIKLIKFSISMVPGKEGALPGIVRLGLQDVHHFFMQSPTSHPDFVYRLQSSKIVPDLLDPTSKVIIRMQINFSSFRENMMCHSCCCIHHTTAGCSKSISYHGKPSIKMPFLNDAVPWSLNFDHSEWNNITIDGFQILHLDGENRITSIELCPISISSTPIQL